MSLVDTIYAPHQRWRAVLQNHPHLGLEPVGFLDDDLGKHEVTS